jgi:hypothetical protein
MSFGKKLQQKETFWKKVTAKRNILEKSYSKKKHFGKNLQQKETF